MHTGFNGTPLYSYMCFKEEVLLGYLSCIIMVLPGVLLSALIIYNLMKKSQKSYIYVAIMASPLLWVSFPFLAFIVKVRIKGRNKYFRFYGHFRIHLQVIHTFVFLIADLFTALWWNMDQTGWISFVLRSPGKKIVVLSCSKNY